MVGTLLFNEESAVTARPGSGYAEWRSREAHAAPACPADVHGRVLATNLKIALALSRDLDCGLAERRPAGPKLDEVLARQVTTLSANAAGYRTQKTTVTQAARDDERNAWELRDLQRLGTFIAELKPRRRRRLLCYLRLRPPSRDAGSVPVAAQKGVQVLVAPGALEPCVLEEVALAAKAKPIKESSGWCIAAIDNCLDAMEGELLEGQGNEHGCRLGGESLALMISGEGKPDFSQARIIAVDEQGAITDESASGLQSYCYLRPSAWGAKRDRRLRRDEVVDLAASGTFPALIASDLGIVAIRKQSVGVGRQKSVEDEPRRLTDRDLGFFHCRSEYELGRHRASSFRSEGLGGLVP